jgi:hypothetical protein
MTELFVAYLTAFTASLVLVEYLDYIRREVLDEEIEAASNY